MKRAHVSPPGRIRSYYELTKPGIVYGNVMTAVAGYLFASRWHIQWVTFLALLGGTALLIAAACAANNCLDRRIDAHMSRTRSRALVTGTISVRSALWYAAALGVLGIFVLLKTNWLTLAVGLSAVFSYVVLYGWAKRHTVHGTLVGTVPGAASLVAGYTAVTGRLDVAALLLFLIMLAWQMPHFYAIAIRRVDEYAAAGLPVWPVRRGVRSTVRQTVAYIALFFAAVCALTLTGYTGVSFLVIMGGLGAWWFALGVCGFRTGDTAWARKTFLFSLIVLTVFSAALPLGVLLP